MSRGSSSSVLGLLLMAASLVAEHGLLQSIGHVGSEVVAHGIGCPEACGLFPGQGMNPRLVHW